MNNCFHTSGKILELLKIPFTNNYLKEEILSHPQFPSLLTISDVLEKYHINTLPLRIGKEKLDQIPLPCIVQVRVQGKEYFQTLSHITGDSFSGYDKMGKAFKVSKEDFFNLKSDPVIFGSLLSRSKKINNPTGDLGILLRNVSPRFQVIKVCNPYCGPCSEAHPELERLVEEGIIDLQIIFFPNNSTDDLHAKTISHLLAINTKGDPKVMQEALDIWYAAEKKDYAVFAGRYPMNGELNQQQEKLLAMKNWCAMEGITHTPTIFINGHELPKEYRIADLKEINTN
jgi:thiol-disulfide isomerase/thioredoxin